MYPLAARFLGPVAASRFAVAGGGGGGAHRYWRIFITANKGDSGYTRVGRVEMYSSAEDGPARINKCIGGTPIFSSEGGSPSGQDAVDAFSPNNTIGWGTSPSGSARLNCWIGYDFGSNIEIDRFFIQSLENFTASAPESFQLEYSDDNSTWTTAQTFGPVAAWVQNEGRLYTLSSYSETYSGSPHGTHRYWRLHMGNSGFSTAFAIAELEMRATPSGSDQCSGGTPTAHAEFSGSENAPKAFDNDNGTLWSASTGSIEGWLQYDFGSGNAVAVAEVSIRARSGFFSSQAPTEGKVEFSDDGTTWNVAWSFIDSTSYSDGEVRVKTDPAYV